MSVQLRSFIKIYMSYRYIHIMDCMSMMRTILNITEGVVKNLAMGNLRCLPICIQNTAIFSKGSIPPKKTFFGGLRGKKRLVEMARGVCYNPLANYVICQRINPLATITFRADPELGANLVNGSTRSTGPIGSTYVYLCRLSSVQDVPLFISAWSYYFLTLLTVLHFHRTNLPNIL